MKMLPVQYPQSGFAGFTMSHFTLPADRHMTAEFHIGRHRRLHLMREHVIFSVQKSAAYFITLSIKSCANKQHSGIFAVMRGVEMQGILSCRKKKF
jgi:hypothetical protein